MLNKNEIKIMFKKTMNQINSGQECDYLIGYAQALKDILEAPNNGSNDIEQSHAVILKALEGE